MNYKLTIIVPVYNAEKYINRCVESLINQTIKEIQIILINDGSTDSSGRLCDILAIHDSRIMVIHKKNGGVSSARNLGLQNAKGEYVGFIDADDWIDPEMYETLYMATKQYEADIAMCDVLTEYENGEQKTDTITQLPDDLVIVKNDFKPSLLMEMAGSVCRCIYRNEKIQNFALKFDLSLKFSEDRVFNIYAMGYANKVTYLKRAFYHRFIQKESAVHRFHADYYEAVKAASIATDKALTAVWNRREEYIKTYKQQYVNGAIAALNNYFYKTSTLNFSQKIESIKRICNDQNLINAIRVNKIGGLRGKWICEKKVYCLAICAYIANKKYRR